MRMVSTRMTSTSGSTRRPCEVTTSSFTDTRPSPMSTSQARREPMPAAASTFCRRIPSGSVMALSSGVGMSVVELVQLGQQRREGGQLLERRQPELLEQQRGGAVERGGGVGVLTRLGDQPAGQQRADDAVDVHPSDGADAPRVTGWR